MSHVLIGDPHPLYRGALRDLLADMFDGFGWDFSSEEAGSIDTLLALAERSGGVEAVLLDMALLGPQGFAHLVTLRGKLPGVPLIVTTATPDPQSVHLCMTCGVAGVIAKSASRDEVVRALNTVFEGGIHMPSFPGLPLTAAGFPFGARRAVFEDHDGGALSGRQAAVLDLVTDGKSNKQIAWELSISETTVKAHMTAILRKLGVSSRAQAIVLLHCQPARAEAAGCDA